MYMTNEVWQRTTRRAYYIANLRVNGAEHALQTRWIGDTLALQEKLQDMAAEAALGNLMPTNPDTPPPNPKRAAWYEYWAGKA